jgi:PAS domain S-box-containing protein
MPLRQASVRPSPAARRDAAQSHWRDALLNAGIEYWEWDAAARRLSGSPRLLSWLGRPAGARRFRLDDWPGLRAVGLPVLLGSSAGDHCTLEHRQPTSDAPDRWLSTTMTVVARAAGGAAARVVGLTADVTDRRRVETRLEVSLERLRDAERGALAGIWDWDIQSGEMFWSPGLFALFGLEPTAPPTFESWKRIVHPDDYELARATIDRAVAERKPLRMEYRVVRADHEVRWIGAIGATRYDEAGRPLRMNGMCVDFTARRRAEDALALSEERLAVVVDAAGIGTWDWNPVTGATTCSATLLALFGLPPETPWSYERFLEAVHPDDRPRVHALTDAVLRKRTEYRVEFRAVWPDGSLHWLASRGHVFFDPHGRPARMTGAAYDITPQKNLERDLVDITTLEQQRIGHFLHDECGQELTALGLLTNSLADVLRVKAPGDMAVARKVAAGLHRVLQRVRGIARGLARAELTAAELPAALADLAERIAESGHVRCSLRGAAVAADDATATHLFHIAQEACTNALRHAGAAEILIRLDSRHGRLTLQVQDDGAGFSDPDAVGLGIRIMRHRANLLGGRLTIDRTRSRRTVVTCRLPKESAHAPQESTG